MTYLPHSKPTVLPAGERGYATAATSLPLDVQQLRDLAENTVDLPTRCHYVLRYLSQQQEKLVFGLSPQALAAIGRYPWSGDLSELERALAGAVQRCKGRVVLPAHLALEQPAARSPQPTEGDGGTGGDHKNTSPHVHVWEPLLKAEPTPTHAPILPFVDLGLLSGRHGDEATEDAKVDATDGPRAPASHILGRRRVASPTVRRVTPSNAFIDRSESVATEASGAAQSTFDGPPAHPQPPFSIRPLREALDEMESQLIAQALRASNHDLSKAAELLHIPRQTLHYRMKALGITEGPSPLAPRPS